MTSAYIEKDVILGLDDFLTDEDLANYTAAEIEAASLDGILYNAVDRGRVQ